MSVSSSWLERASVPRATRSAYRASRTTLHGAFGVAVSAVAMLAVAGCGTTQNNAERASGEGRDASSAHRDAGAPRDGGTHPSVDAAVIIRDAGVPEDGWRPAVCNLEADLTRTCETVGDCIVVYHRADCCGNVQAIGVSSHIAAYFAERERACRATVPTCSCPTRSETRTDSDELAPDTSAIRVACALRGSAGSCFSYVSAPPPP